MKDPRNIVANKITANKATERDGIGGTPKLEIDSRGRRLSYLNSLRIARPSGFLKVAGTLRRAVRLPPTVVSLHLFVGGRHQGLCLLHFLDSLSQFFGDNGRLDARGIRSCFDSGIHVPLTTLAIGGTKVPLSMQSRPLMADDLGPAREFAIRARNRIDETSIRQRSVRGKRFHCLRNFTPSAGLASLNRYREKCFLVKPLMREMLAAGTLTGPSADLMKPFPNEMLFDTQQNPFEIRDLAESPVHQQTLRSMRKGTECLDRRDT